MSDTEDKDDHLHQHFELVKTMYLRMQKENSWPWVTDPEWWNEQFPDKPR